jgi:hypothetical protein
MVQIASPLILVPHPHLSTWSPLHQLESEPGVCTTIEPEERETVNSRASPGSTDDDNSSFLASDSECDLEIGSSFRRSDDASKRAVPTYKYHTHAPYQYSYASHPSIKKSAKASKRSRKDSSHMASNNTRRHVDRERRRPHGGRRHSSRSNRRNSEDDDRYIDQHLKDSEARGSHHHARHREVMSGALPIPNDERGRNRPPQIRYSAAQGRFVDASQPPMRYSALQDKFVPISEPPWQPELHLREPLPESSGVVLKSKESSQSSSIQPHTRRGKEKVQDVTWIPQSDTATSQPEPSLPPRPLSEMSYDSSATFQRRRTAEVSTARSRKGKEQMLPTTTALPVRTTM